MNVTISVAVITYQHEAYIRECLDSIIGQKGDFSLEVIIGEDCGQDSTYDICKEYEAKHPDIIRVLESKQNLGVMPNFVRVMKEAKGDFVAICEGDDFWIDEFKLQKQLDFMNSNPECTLCFHNAEIRHEGFNRKDGLFVGNTSKKFYSSEDLIKEFRLPTASYFYRKASFDIPEWIAKVYNGDYSIALILSDVGQVGYADFVGSVYRKNVFGLSGRSKNSMVLTRIAQVLWYFDVQSNFKYHDEIVQRNLSMGDAYKMHAMGERTKSQKMIDGNFWLGKLKKLFK